MEGVNHIIRNIILMLLFFVQDLIIELTKMVKSMDKTLSRVMDVVEQLKKNGTSATMHEAIKEEKEDMINGVNVMRIPSRDAYSYALRLMEMLFTKEEMSSSLIFKSKKVKSLA